MTHTTKAERDRLKAAPERLNLLADWFDLEDAKAREALGRMMSDEVQRDLRSWADLIARLVADVEAQAALAVEAFRLAEELATVLRLGYHAGPSVRLRAIHAQLFPDEAAELAALNETSDG